MYITLVFKGKLLQDHTDMLGNKLLITPTSLKCVYLPGTLRLSPTCEDTVVEDQSDERSAGSQHHSSAKD